MRAGGYGVVRQTEEGVTVGFYSPLPPARTGVADYAAALLDALRAHARPEGEIRVAPTRSDVALYHIGNNKLHAEIYRRALTNSGVVVLHDAVLHHFLLGQLDRGAYIDEFVYNYGEWNRALAESLWTSRAASGADARYFEYPMLRRIAESSLAVIVHNPSAADAVKAHAPHALIIEIPHLFAGSPSISGAEALRYRQRIGIDPGGFVFGIFGYLRESKRIAQTIGAFHLLHAEMRNTALLVAGDFVSTDLERSVAPLLRSPGIVRVPFLEERNFWVAASAVDACINLKYPAAGETSGIAIRLMGIGKPVLLTHSTESSRYPEDACIRIPAGVAERESLLEHMRLLAARTGVAEAIGCRAAAHIARDHSPRQVAEAYWKALA